LRTKLPNLYSLRELQIVLSVRFTSGLHNTWTGGLHYTVIRNMVISKRPGSHRIRYIKLCLTLCPSSPSRIMTDGRSVSQSVSQTVSQCVVASSHLWDSGPYFNLWSLHYDFSRHGVELSHFASDN